jgi:ABC-type nitrate/sulfonate/bicarbonate transport system permease component
MSIVLSFVIGAIVGVVTGALVFRNNAAKIEATAAAVKQVADDVKKV